jgi:hypothetical protein
MWIEIKDNANFPDVGEHVLVRCRNMVNDGTEWIIIAKFYGNNEWYASFPYDQPVEPTHWCYSMKL